MKKMKLMKYSRRVSLAIALVILIGSLVTGIVYNQCDLMEQWGFYGNTDVLVLMVILFVLMLLDYLTLKYAEKEEQDEKYNKKFTRIFIELIGMKLFFALYLFLMFIKWIMEIIMGSFLFDVYYM